MNDALIFGCTIPLSPPDVVLRCAIMAEKSGYDSIWFPDHIVTTDPSIVCTDTWAMIPAIGMRTNKVMLCDGVSDPYRRNPSVLAQTVATVDHLTGGRVVLGLGAGEDMNLEPFGLSRLEKSRKRRQKLREAVLVIKMLWDATVERPADFDGEFFKLKNAFLSIKPVQSPHPPIYIGAMGPKTREMVGELADGYYPLVVAKELLPSFIDDIKKGAARVGRKISEIDCAARVFAAVSEDRKDARTQVIDRAKRHLVLDGGATLKALGFDLEIKGNITTMLSGFATRDYIAELFGKVPDEAAEAISIFGTVEDCIEQIEKYLKAGATQLITFTASEASIANFAEVISYFKEQRE